MLPKMSYQFLIVFCLQIMTINTAPLFLMPIPWMPQTTQDMVLQEQLMELQALRQLNLQSPFAMNNQQPQPIMILMPNPLGSNTNELLNLHKDNEHKSAIQSNDNEEDDLNSITVNAAPQVMKEKPAGNQAINSQPQRTLLFLPNSRLSIGEIISGIPWLPFEVNVPDTIAWAYNGIASGIGSIITIIGRPFQGMTQDSQVQEMALKSLLNQMQTRRQSLFRPLVMVPIDGPALPIQV